MKLTRTRRIIVAAVGLAFLLLVLFPPLQSGTARPDGVDWVRCGHKWVFGTNLGKYQQLDIGLLMPEIALVLIVAGVLAVVLRKKPTLKTEPDRPA
jgi:hypothetical protein